jgi:hypothetical protein
MEDVPNELLLIIASNLNIKDLTKFAKTSTKHRRVAHTTVQDRLKGLGMNNMSYSDKIKFLDIMEKLRFDKNFDFEMIKYYKDWILGNFNIVVQILNNITDNHPYNNTDSYRSVYSTHFYDIILNQDEIGYQFMLDIGFSPDHTFYRDNLHVFSFSQNPTILGLALQYGMDPYLEDDDVPSRMPIGMLSMDEELAEKVLTYLIDNPYNHSFIDISTEYIDYLSEMWQNLLTMSSERPNITDLFTILGDDRDVSSIIMDIVDDINAMINISVLH